MDIGRKMELAKQAIDMISRADDTPEKINAAALDDLVAHIAAEKKASTKRRADKAALDAKAAKAKG